MTRLSRYLFGQLFFTALFVTLALTTIMWLAQSIRYIDYIANKGVSLLLFFQMILYLFPNLVVIIAPIAVLIAVLFIFNKLIADHELVVMQSAGLSYWQLAKPVFALGVVFTLIVYVVSLYLLPLSFRKYRDISTSLREKSLISLVQVGQFNTFGRYTVYTKRQDAQGNFLGILIYEGVKGENPTIFMAEKGIILDKDKGGRIHLINGNRQEQDLTTRKPSVLYFDRYTLEAKEKESGEPKGERFLKAYERSIGDLFNPKEELNIRTNSKFFSAAHQRLLSPLYALAFALLGVCFMILGHFNRKERTFRILVPCLIASLLEVCALVFLHTLKYVHLFIPLSYGIILLTIATCLLALTSWGSRFPKSLSWRKAA